MFIRRYYAQFYRDASLSATSSLHRTGRPKLSLTSTVTPLIPETIECLLATAILVALGALLHFLDRQRRSELPISLARNTYVALLSTACRFMTAIRINAINEMDTNSDFKYLRRFVWVVEIALMLLLPSLLESFATQFTSPYENQRKETPSITKSSSHSKIVIIIRECTRPRSPSNLAIG